ncbi:ATP-dependent sacrificial sulfur transferase LarE [Allorhodopirellula heiligendammensis]|uniref:tRNA-specific 2-thiouridylase MnmA n=1 Tax=Allorhodopirellula heiligendammensis TaxID=2714739 RepID=A0A5C6C3P8_9BACT|nr:ATP-dependent sacrificial sulfur transferase LarE [Allorhodopirellula heiligendammensis]TWU18231.1 tRNA-specific 2-thiouridylase MnmA [Allorhodopirellula heiligendammensis]|tara:strand:+ start:187 stop:1044 length:858 start_codon:yes stop_codon:yes gene_type:complete
MNDGSPLLNEAKAAQRLIDAVASLGNVVVAFSGGVDSSVVAAAAVHAAQRGQSNCIAVTAQSPSLASWQAELALRVSSEMGIEHEFVATDEIDREGYVRNRSDRCFYCKQTLYEFLQPIAKQRDAVIVSGTNADDLGDHRPGLIAGRQANVHTPLADLGFTKGAVREIAEWFGLSNADLPASPCLSSRIAYDVEVTRERLARIDAAESWLRERGIGDLRVRLLAGELACIEVIADQMRNVVDLQHNASLAAAFTAMGFRNVTLDLRGLRSGSMNESLVTLSNVQP